MVERYFLPYDSLILRPKNTLILEQRSLVKPSRIEMNGLGRSLNIFGTCWSENERSMKVEKVSNSYR